MKKKSLEWKTGMLPMKEGEYLCACENRLNHMKFFRLIQVTEDGEMIEPGTFNHMYLGGHIEISAHVQLEFPKKP